MFIRNRLNKYMIEDNNMNSYKRTILLYSTIVLFCLYNRVYSDYNGFEITSIYSWSSTPGDINGYTVLTNIYDTGHMWYIDGKYVNIQNITNSMYKNDLIVRIEIQNDVVQNNYIVVSYGNVSNVSYAGYWIPELYFFDTIGVLYTSGCSCEILNYYSLYTNDYTKSDFYFNNLISDLDFPYYGIPITSFPNEHYVLKVNNTQTESEIVLKLGINGVKYMYYNPGGPGWSKFGANYDNKCFNTLYFLNFGNTDFQISDIEVNRPLWYSGD